MTKSAIPPDIEIAQSVKLRPIVDVASELGLAPEDIEPYGHYKAKVRLEVSPSTTIFTRGTRWDWTPTGSHGLAVWT